MKKFLLGMFCLLVLCCGSVLAQDKMIITLKDGRVLSFDTNSILKIEYLSAQPSSTGAESSQTIHGKMVSIQSYNYQTHFIRHANFLAEITPISSELDKKDSTFKVVPGLADNRCISFESVNYPGHYLRHQGGRLKLHQPDGSQLFREDASFKMIQGLADGSWLSFESFNYPGQYIRHRDFHLYIEKGDGDLFRKDTTFRFAAPKL